MVGWLGVISILKTTLKEEVADDGGDDDDTAYEQNIVNVRTAISHSLTHTRRDDTNSFK